MWKEHEDEDKKSEKRRQRKKGRFRTVKTEAPDMEIFETENVDSDAPLSDESGSEDDADETIMDQTMDERQKNKKKITIENQEE